MSKIPERISTLRGNQVALTGKFPGTTQSELVRQIRKKGGSVASKYGVTAETVILVRGDSKDWKYESHGRKEEEAARHIRNGQVLAVVEYEEFEKLLNGQSARCSDVVAGQQIAYLVAPPTPTTFLRIARIEGPLDRECTARGRVEQAYLRALLFNDKENAPCRLCGKIFPVKLMWAAHIKPRATCSYDERIDENIVFGLCTLGCDALYEKGYLGVNDKGISVSMNLTGLPVALRQRLKILAGRRCTAWNPQTREYFSWHLRRRL